MKIQTAAVTTPGHGAHPRGFFVQGSIFVSFQIRPLSGIDPKQEVQTLITSLRMAVKTAKREKADMLSVLRECLISYSGVESAVMGSVEGTTIRLCGLGQSLILCVREDRVGTVMVGDDSVSGLFEQGDTFFCLNRQAAELIPPDGWKSIATAGTIEEMADAVLAGFPDDAPSPPTALIVAPALPWKKNLALSVHRWRHRPLSSSSPRLSRKQRIVFALSGVCIVVLTMSVFITIKHTQDVARQHAYEQTIYDVEKQIDEAISLQNLNPVRSRELLAQAKRQSSKVLGTYDKKSPQRQVLQQWIEKTITEELRVNHIYQLSSVPLFFDIGFIKPGGQATQLASYHELKVLLDDVNHIVYILATDTKQARILAGPDTVKDARSLAIHGTTVYLLTSEGVVAIDTDNGQSRLAIPREEQWGEILSVATYGGNIYLLDRTHQTIWKYILTEEGYEPLDRYIPEGETIEIAPDACLTIDGSIWVNNHTQVHKFTTGFAQPFAPSEVPDALATIDRLAASDVDQFLYLLDSPEQRIVVLSKEGVYQGQYRWVGLRQATDITVSEAEHKLFVLVGSKVYAIALQ